MARKRMISPEIWQSEDFAKLSLLAKLLFVGIFSHADDEGRGRAKADYLKSVVFPYDSSLRVSDVDKALNEIASHMSAVFYKSDGNEYYMLTNWNLWQKVDKPQKSKLPKPDGCEYIRTGDTTSMAARRGRPKKGERAGQANRSDPFGADTQVAVCGAKWGDMECFGSESKPVLAENEAVVGEDGAKWGKQPNPDLGERPDEYQRP